MPNVKREEDGAEHERPKKKRRVSDPPNLPAKSPEAADKKAMKESSAKGVKPVGSMIGRKRKERKMKKAGK